MFTDEELPFARNFSFDFTIEPRKRVTRTNV